MSENATPVEVVRGAADLAGLKPKRSGTGWLMSCPGANHRRGDKRPGLSLSEGRDGRALLKCHAGCDTAEVVHELGLSPADLFTRDDRATVTPLRRPPRTLAEHLGTARREPLRETPSPAATSTATAVQIVPAVVPAVVEPTACTLPACERLRAKDDGPGECIAQYVYRDADGEPVYQAHRYDPKDFRPFTPDGSGRWKSGGKSSVPYRLPEVRQVLAAGGLVVITEGEKDADAVNGLNLDGVAATCNAAGALKWTDEHSQALADALAAATVPGGGVCIVGDTDAAGQKHVRQVCESLAAVGIVAAVGWPTRGKDFAEHLANGGTFDELRADPVEDDDDEPGDPWPALGRVLSIDDLDELPPIRPLVRGWLSTPSAAVLVGEYGLGKTAVTMALAASVASGTPFVGDAVEQRRVLYVIGEGARGMSRRVRAWERAWGRTIPRDALSFMVRPRESLRTLDTWHQLRDYCMTEGVGFVVLDTLSALAYDADETKDAPVIMRGLTDLAEAIDGTALLVHHSGWSDKTRTRGGSQFESNADEVLVMTETAKGASLLTVEVKKSKDGESGRKHYLNRIVVELGTDADDEPISSVTVEGARASDASTPLRARVLAHLADMEGEGATRSELAQACGVERTHGAFNRAVRSLVNDGEAHRVGSTTRCRYYLPEHAPRD